MEITQDKLDLGRVPLWNGWKAECKHDEACDGPRPTSATRLVTSPSRCTCCKELFGACGAHELLYDPSGHVLRSRPVLQAYEDGMPVIATAANGRIETEAALLLAIEAPKPQGAIGRG